MNAPVFGDQRLPLRFWSKAVVDTQTGCWRWTAARASGYGKYMVGSRTTGNHRLVVAHRLAYETLVAIVPRELDMDHLCRRRECINPAHLEPVTHAENCRRGLGAVAFKRIALEKVARTHCGKGHPRDQFLSIQKGNGARVCLACSRMAWQRYVTKQGKGWRKGRRSP